ncbi:MAG: 3-deoxy-D-manno-octulosonic acid transferase [Mariprofundaceae bacterium]
MGHSPAPGTQPPVKWKQHLTIDLPAKAVDAIWVHACSVGEVSSVAPLIRALKTQNHCIHLTVVTRTGMAHARRLFGDALSISYLPWDIPGLMTRLVNRLQPRLLLLTETEFWPGMLSACRRRAIPVIGINTRISDQSFPRYRMTSRLWQHWLGSVSMFLAQSNLDAERLQSIGVPAERIQVAGNLKYAVHPPDIDASALRNRIDASGQRPILLVASTHDDEEAQILRMWNLWKQDRHDLLCVMVPRHPERFDAVVAQINQAGFAMSRWSEKETRGDFILVDAMGVLPRLYAVADIVIIGGSLVPIGGHNPLEAAICGRGVITGPHIQNFREIMTDMQRGNAAIVAANADEIEKAVQRLLTHADELKNLHAHASMFMQDKAQVLDHVCRAIAPYLDAGQHAPEKGA